MLTGNELSEYTMVQPVDYMEFDKSENPDRLYVAVSDGSGTTGSGSIYYLQMNPQGGGALLPVKGCLLYTSGKPNRSPGGQNRHQYK